MALLAYWKCDENQGRDVTAVADSSGHANNHDFTSVGYASGSVGFVNKNRHANAQAGDRHISANNNADFQLAGDMTIMAWLYPILIPNNTKYIVGCGAGGTSEAQADNMQWALVWSTTGQFGMQWEQGLGVDVFALTTSTPILTLVEGPLHIAVVRTINGANRDVKFYLNGADLAEDVTGLTPPDGGANAVCEMLRIPGADSNIPKANIWNVRIYDTAESPASVGAIFAAELSEALRVAYTPNPSDSLIRYEENAFNAYDLAPQIVAPITRNGNNAYGSTPTGTNLDLEQRPNSGWAQAGP